LPTAFETGRVKQEGEQMRAEIAEHKQAIKAAVAERDQVRAELAMSKTEVGRLTDQLKDQKTRSVGVIGRLEEGKQKMEAELTEIRRESRELSSNLGKALG
jgi:septal ring factor EnvC (AmiA/AmiB activator)